MRALSRREWVDLVSAHPGVDPANPTDAFATALLDAVGGDPGVWEDGGEEEATRAYAAAITVARRDSAWARRLLLADPTVALLVRVSVEHGVSLDEFLAWSDRAQDLAIEYVLLREDRCPNGHPRDAMTDPDLVKIGRTHCGVCERLHGFEQRFKDLGPEATVGWHTEVTRVSR